MEQAARLITLVNKLMTACELTQARLNLMLASSNSERVGPSHGDIRCIFQVRDMVQKIVVIGAGVIGASIAASLSKRGAQVTIITRDRLGGSTSSGTFAWLNALQKYPAEYVAMNVNGMRLHAEYASRHSSAPWYHAGGNVEWTFGGSDTEQQEQVLQKMRSFGYEGRWITVNELQSMEPDINPLTFTGAHILYYPMEGWVDAPLLVGRLLADARANNTQIVHGDVASFSMSSDRIEAVLLADGGRIDADIVVNAAGPAAAAIADLAGSFIPMKNEPGVQIYTSPIAASIGRIMHGPRISMRPDGGGRLCLHNHGIDREIVNRPGIDKSIVQRPDGGLTFDLAAAEPLLARAAEVYPAIRGATAEAARVAMRPIPVDRKPVIGFMATASNLYSSVMHSGVTQCLWVGELVARELIGDDDLAELASFRPSRFAQENRAAG